MLNFYSFSWIKASKSCCCIRPINSTTIPYQYLDSQLLRLNSSCEFAFFLLEFHCKLIVHLCVSLVYISQEIISVTWSVLWPTNPSSIHECLCFDWKIYLGVTNYQLFYLNFPISNNDIFHLFMYYNLTRLLFTILFSISPCYML
jgi:hypothetical protein